jgi:REP element-mobilizing transposase RayT
LRLYAYIGGIIRTKGGSLLQIEGIEDHVHFLVCLPLTKSVSEIIQEVKGCSSKWSNEQPEVTEKFGWQKGYGIFTVSESQIESVSKYIQHQIEHHRTKTFIEEYTLLLERHHLTFKHEHLFEGEHSLIKERGDISVG